MSTIINIDTTSDAYTKIISSAISRIKNRLNEESISEINVIKTKNGYYVDVRLVDDNGFEVDEDDELFDLIDKYNSTKKIKLFSIEKFVKLTEKQIFDLLVKHFSSDFDIDFMNLDEARMYAIKHISKIFDKKTRDILKKLTNSVYLAEALNRASNEEDLVEIYNEFSSIPEKSKKTLKSKSVVHTLDEFLQLTESQLRKYTELYEIEFDGLGELRYFVFDEGKYQLDNDAISLLRDKLTNKDFLIRALNRAENEEELIEEYNHIKNQPSSKKSIKPKSPTRK
jgi:hypothetical protein